MERVLRALLVEDNEISAEIVDLQLRDIGFEVTRAGNGQQAVSAFQNSEEGYFNIIIMDIMMPVMDGIKATSLIRHQQRSDAASVPIIAVTANTFSDYDAFLRKEGVSECITKPFSKSKLQETVLSLVNEP